jgi:glutaredoxin
LQAIGQGIMKFIIRSFFKVVRAVLGPILLFLDFITSPKGVERPASEQQAIDSKTAVLALYQFRACPFCIKVRRAIKRLSLNIELRNAQHDQVNRQALLQGGGDIKVPCLRIHDAAGEDIWLYESDEIIAYLNKHFAG